MTTPTRPHRLSKSRFVAGCQCHKLLWWRVHEPNAEELQPDIVLQDRFDQGRQVGEMARDRPRMTLKLWGHGSPSSLPPGEGRCGAETPPSSLGMGVEGGGCAGATGRRVPSHRGQIVIVAEGRAHSGRSRPETRAGAMRHRRTFCRDHAEWSTTPHSRRHGSGVCKSPCPNSNRN